MDWSDLKFVLAIGRTGSLVAAGRALGVEHTTVSRRLSAIERALGVQLFAKCKDGARPTPEGQRAITAAEDIERIVVGLETAIVGVDEREEGRVRVTVSDGFFPVLVAHLPRLYAARPHILVEVLAGNRVLDLQRGEADLALRMVPTTQPELIARRVSETGWALYAAPEYLARSPPVGAPPALASHRVIAYDEPMNAVPGNVWLQAHAAGAEVVLRGNGIPVVLSAASAGIGLACLPCLVADRDARLKRVSGVVASGNMWLVAHPDRLRSARVRVVWDFLVDLVERERAILTGVPGP